MKSPERLFRGVIEAARRIKAGKIDRNDNPEILKVIREYCSEATEADIKNVIERLDKPVRQN